VPQRQSRRLWLDAAYRMAGFEVQVLDAEGRKGHLLVTFPLGGTYRVDVLKEQPSGKSFAKMSEIRQLP
jgi:hypothetical protein